VTLAVNSDDPDGMEVIRSRPVANFTQITNDVLRDKRLSHMARGVLGEMLSHADGWKTSADRMWRQARKDRPGPQHGEGQRAYRAVFRELEKAGYLERRKMRTKTGQFKTCLILHDEPVVTEGDASPREDEANPASHVAEPQPRSSPAETPSFPSSDPCSGNAAPETATSLRTLDEEHWIEDFGADALASRRARAASQRRRDQAWIIAEVRDTIAFFYSQDEAGDLSDWQVWQLWEELRGDRPDSAITSIPRYLSKPFTDAPNLDSLLANYVCPE